MDGGSVTRVGVLTYGLDRPLSGVSRVALELGRALRSRDDLDVTFLTPYRRGPFIGEPGTRSCYLPGCRLLPGLMAFGGPIIAVVARVLGLDVVHDPIGVSPFTVGRALAPFRRVVTVHDAIAHVYPEGYPFLNNFLHRRYIPATLRNVDVVATDSEHAAGELARFLRLDRRALRVIPLAISPAFRPVAEAEARSALRKYGIEPPYLLYVGAFQSRKNVIGLLEAFRRARERLQGRRLVLVGPSPWGYPELTRRLQSGDDEGVTFVGYVADQDLPAVYSAAELFVFPSLYEGFGIPVLEAMACGTPVVASAATSLPEVAADAAVLVDARDPDAMAEAMVWLAGEPALKTELTRRGRERAARFSWTAVAEQYADVYHGVARVR